MTPCARVAFSRLSFFPPTFSKTSTMSLICHLQFPLRGIKVVATQLNYTVLTDNWNKNCDVRTRKLVEDK